MLTLSHSLCLAMAHRAWPPNEEVDEDGSLLHLLAGLDQHHILPPPVYHHRDLGGQRRSVRELNLYAPIPLDKPMTFD